MRYRAVTLGGYDFNLPQIILGSVRFGSKVARKTAFELMDTYHEAGGTWLDTARVYNVELVPPEQRVMDPRDSEYTIGVWLRERGLRDQFTVITKGAHKSLADNSSRLNEKAIRYDIDTSLSRFGHEYFDVYLLHGDNPAVPVEEIMPVLHELVKAGKTRIIGTSTWTTARIKAANDFARKNGLTPFSISMERWSYAAPTPQMPAEISMEGNVSQYQGHIDLNMPVLAYSSQAKGFFYKAARNGLTPEGLGSSAPFLCEENIRRAQAVMELSRREGISISAASFAYLWSRKIPVAALIGSTTPEQIKDSLLDCDYVPTPQALKLLENPQ
jgi:aryl-alcohol dehydrogenase-like predicted oxidoreductase